MNKMILIAALVLAGTASAQTGQVFDRYEVEGTVTNLKLVPNFGGFVSGNVAGQKYFGATEGVSFYGTARVGAEGYTAFNERAFGVGFVEAELLAKDTGDVGVFGSFRHNRSLNAFSQYSNTWKIGVRVGGLVR